MSQVPPNVKKAIDIIQGVKGKTLSQDEQIAGSIELAAIILREANATLTSDEKALQDQMSAMMSDTKGKVFTTTLTDRSLRSNNSIIVADQMVYLMEKYGIPSYFPLLKRSQLQAFKLSYKISSLVSYAAVPLAIASLKQETSKTIILSDDDNLKEHIEKRLAEGVKINVNFLGEAMLGEEDATERYNAYIEAIKGKIVDYMSIKISTIYSQINTLAPEKTLRKLSERLSGLYRAAMESSPHKFINLDMEEYKDLRITVDLFKSVLSQPEFKNLSAGIVLQAYLPDSFAVQQELTEWAMKRVADGGAPIKIRIVKGANMMSEQAEASLYGWPQAPYKTKDEVDANYKRMIVYAFQKQHAKAAHIGVGSHNLFEIAFALLLRAENGVEESVIFEMLEGMADNIRRVVQAIAGTILLYCPVASSKDYHIAVAYLIRRLDENTAPGNFLSCAWGLTSDSKEWQDQVARFTKAVKEMDKSSLLPRRNQDRSKEMPQPPQATYHHAEDTDFTLQANISWADQIRHDNIAHFAAIKAEQKPLQIPLVINGKEISSKELGESIDPSTGYCIAQHALALTEDIDKALASAKTHQKSWGSKTFKERALILRKAAGNITANRGLLMGAMMANVAKTFQEADPEISEAIDFANYYANSLSEMEAHSDLKFTPKGVVLVAPPWNFPVAIPCGGIVGALAAGNCVIFKPAPEAVLCGWELVKLLWNAGVPKEALQFINCQDDPVGSYLISHPQLDAVILTGSTATAKLFLKLRPALDLAAETGGKNAIIVTALSDRDAAVKDIVQSAFGHAGQKCSAASLVILEKEVYEDENFKRQLRDAVESLQVGSAWDSATKIPPLTLLPSPNLLKGMNELVGKESWLVKPKIGSNNPHLVYPGIKYGVVEGSFMHQTELFGPILSVMCADNLDHALRLANGTAYGLTSGIHSLDERQIEKWKDKIEAGNLYINRGITGAIVQRQPFGGWKTSSYGRGIKAGGINYVSQFTHIEQKSFPKYDGVLALETPKELINLAKQVNNATWVASFTSYKKYYTELFSKAVDDDLIIGQDNFSIYKPMEKMAFRIGKDDPLIDVLRVLAAAKICKTAMTISTSDSSVRASLEPLNIITEDDDLFNKRIEKGEFARIRLLSAPKDPLIQAAATSMTYLDSAPVLANGRYELLHYLREESISYNYGRYGYLGDREEERPNRAPIL